ncbi:succinate dehydrogenase, hydrophobic membrane anchor protein [Mariluticola halotolerans]|uniref:succinate dehydrogenase, hydrophobic membrane anchor protein n=1 Tax=Mariluticola halotolerans TaxID=2909283 RepID=UPI0026E44EF6|nr:succinate dehydrogenase, hydrophobic membrane anchor protein [Mariluticola halotolerans]UJQ93664.1 succinate dehydrogenase, hydrophobic membrane anchor protein [Mariluticola halotolerans]
MNMRTPLSIVTGLGSSREGTIHFWHQRLTALANVPLTLFLVWFIIRVAGLDQAGMMEVMSNPLIAGLLILAMISMTWHMRLGLQIIIEDYVHTEGRKIALLAANNLFATGIAGLCIVSILKLSFGS